MSENVALRRVIVHVGGMSCSGCEDAVTRAVAPLDGVGSVRASLAERAAHVAFMPPCTIEKIGEAIEKAGYDFLGADDDATSPVRSAAMREAHDDVENGAVDASATGRDTGRGASRAAGDAGAPATVPASGAGSFDALYLLIIAVGAFVVAQNLGVNRLFQAIPTVSGQNVGYLALFTIGLLTSVHCVAMCGGINIAQSTALPLPGGRERTRFDFASSSLRYNAGRLTSYTLIGGILGLVGQAASITLGVRSAIGLAAGIVMLLAGVAMAGGFPFLARLAPRVPAPLRSAAASFARRGPFALGLVNGFMPCGPLQAMQVYAITTGSFAAGALSMFSFCLGTIPLVLVFGIVAGAMKRTWRHVMLRASAVMMVLFGLFMVQSNLAISGIRLPLPGAAAGQVAQAQVDGDVQRVTTQLRADGYDGIQVKAGVPVEWTIHADAQALNGCNAEIVLPDFGQQVKLAAGDTVIKFTPSHAGTYNFSCWMGMLHGSIVAS